MSLSLPTESFLAIATVAWADGWMKKTEIDGLLSAARACGLGDDDRAAVAVATKDGVDLDTLDLGHLGSWERALTYSIATWLAKLDGITNAKELEALKALGTRLDLSPRQMDKAASAAFDIACLPEGNRPERFDFDALCTRLREKVPTLVDRD
jgi:hypothetical protein